MSKFSIIKIANLGRIVTGRTPPSSIPQYFGGEIPFLTPTDMTDGSRYASAKRFLSISGAELLERLVIPPDSVCCVCIASIGLTCLTNSMTVTNQQINSIVVNTDSFDPRFVYYKMRTLGNTLKARASGVAQPVRNIKRTARPRRDFNRAALGRSMKGSDWKSRVWVA